MADTHQTLFSFEFFVEYVRVDDTRKMNNVEPAVAVRLLDFPTLLIYRSENDSSSKPDSETFSLSEENMSFAYSFKKGKSCLFKTNLNSLHIQLSNTPLYTMLLDVRGNIPKLIGSSLISLAKLTDHIKLDVEKRGIWIPASYGEKVVTPLLNLMGENVGAISLAYKIVSLGAILIPESRLDEIDASLKPNIASTENNGAIQPCLSESVTSNAHAQPACFDEQPTEVLLSETKATHVVAVTTQTELIKKKDISVVTEVKCGGDDDDDDLLCSTFCPPPLFYSSSEGKQHDVEMESLRMANLNNKDTEDEKSFEMECTYEPKGDQQERLFSDVGVPNNHTMPSLLRDVILQLPLLNALIGELSQLSDHIHQQHPPLSVSPNLIRLCTSAEQPSPTPASGKEAKTADSPIQKIFQPLSSRQSNCHVPFKGQQERPYVKSKLRYGLTHTFHLRLKRVKLAMTKQHECPEQFKIKQTKSQTFSKPKNHNSTSHVLKRDQNESVGKLFCNLEIDTGPLKVISDLTKNTNACKNITMQHMSLNSLKAKGFYFKSDKEVQVNIPSTLRQNSDHNDELSAKNDHTNCDILSSRESDKEDSRPCGCSYRSASSLDSVESDEYQEDFTSLDPTERSPEPLSSPEPGRSRRGQVSNVSSSSCSSFHGNTSHPVLVKLSHSPEHRHRTGTYVIKPHLKTSVLGTVSDDKSFSASISTNSSPRQRSYESQSLPKRMNLSRSYKMSKSMQSDFAEESALIAEHSMNKNLPSNDYMLDSVSSPDPDEERDELASLGFQNKYHPISDLVMNKLPGYTL